jgi:hypothetical protein
MIHEQKLERWAEREFRRHVDNIIVDDVSNGLLAFGKYYLQPNSTGCTVTQADDTCISFSNKKTAISWCVADKFKQYTLANSIKTLDQKRQLLSADVNYHQHQLNRTRNTEFADTVAAKLSIKASKLAAINTELEKCIKTAKYFQIRGFSNETARTRVS